MFSTLKSLLQKPKNIITLVVGSILVFTLLRIIPQFHIIRDFWQLQGVSWSRKFEVVYDYAFGEFSLWQLFQTTITIVLTLMIVLNAIVFVAYFQQQQRVFKKRSFIATVSGMILGIFGLGCISCGAIIMAPLLTLIGLGAYATVITQYAIPLSILGIILVVFSTLYLLKKMNEPQVCT